MQPIIKIRLIAIMLLATLLAGFAAAQAGTFILSLSPSSAPAGTPGLTLVVTGFGFVPGATLFWRDSPLATTYISPTQLQAVVTPGQLAIAGPVAVTVIIPSGLRSPDVVFTVRSADLSIGPDSLPAGSVNSAYSAIFTATGGTTPYVWQAREPLPPGLTLSTAGTLSGTPTTAGTYAFSILATDAQQQTGTRSYNLVIGAPRLSISSASPLPPATEGLAYSFSLRTDAAIPPVRWSATSLPAGLTLDATTGVLSGTPTLRGTYNIAVQAADASSTVSKTLTLEVQRPPLTISTVSPLFDATVGAAYSQTFTATGGQTPYRWSMQGTVPGLTLDPATGALTGTPTTAGTYTVTIDATDAANGRNSKAFTLRVVEPQLTITNASPLPSGTVGQPYTQRFLASGGRAPYSWSIVSGQVPGLSLNAVTGVLGDTLTAPGTFNFVVQVRDSAGLVTTKPFSVTISAGPLQLTRSPEPLRAVAGQPFSTEVASASGGTPPYAFSANGLPDGLTVDPGTGKISGTPTAPGSFPFTVRVVDAARASTTELYQLEVAGPSIPSLRTPELSGTVRPADQIPVRLQIDQPYTLPLNGQLLLSFTPDTGSGDPAVQFSTGGRSVDFTLPAGATTATFRVPDLALQTGTVAGTIALQASLFSTGFQLTATPVPVTTLRIERGAPVITSATFTRTSSGFEVRVVGFATAREVTQAVFRFSAAAGQTLRTPEITLSVEQMFGTWYGTADAATFGGQFSFRQQFTTDSNASAVTPVSVTLTNRVGSSTASASPQ